MQKQNTSCKLAKHPVQNKITPHKTKTPHFTSQTNPRAKHNHLFVPTTTPRAKNKTPRAKKQNPSCKKSPRAKIEHLVQKQQNTLCKLAKHLVQNKITPRKTKHPILHRGAPLCKEIRTVTVGGCGDMVGGGGVARRRHGAGVLQGAPWDHRGLNTVRPRC